MGYTEKEVWRMTMRKLLLLWGDYRKFNGAHDEAETIDDAIPL